MLIDVKMKTITSEVDWSQRIFVWLFPPFIEKVWRAVTEISCQTETMFQSGTIYSCPYWVCWGVLCFSFVPVDTAVTSTLPTSGGDLSTEQCPHRLPLVFLWQHCGIFTRRHGMLGILGVIYKENVPPMTAVIHTGKTRCLVCTLLCVCVSVCPSGRCLYPN